MSLGSNSSSNSQTSTSEQYGSKLNPMQGNFLQNMWGAGANVANTGQSQQMGMQGYNQSQEALGGQNMQGAFNTLGRMQNPGMDPQMAMYSKQVGQNFNEQVLPGLRSQAQAVGGYGGSRAGIAEGLAGARAGQQIQDFGAQLYGQNQDRAMNAGVMAGNLAGNQSQGYMQSGSFGMGVPWYAQQQLAGLLGGPIIENLGGRASGSGSGGGSGWNIGGL